MRKRAQLFSAMPPGADNIEFLGLRRGQIVTVNTREYRGKAKLVGCPPQGTGIYAVTQQGQRLWLTGEEIAEATEPS